jgi:hypothetical protein
MAYGIGIGIWLALACDAVHMAKALITLREKYPFKCRYT